MTKHTPGPWKAETDETVPERGAVYVEGPQGWRDQAICDCAYSDGGVEEDEANARLIAAAPDIYKALVALIAAYDRHPGIGVETLRGEFEAARAALAMAEG